MSIAFSAPVLLDVVSKKLFGVLLCDYGFVEKDRQSFMFLAGFPLPLLQFEHKGNGLCDLMG